jgi:hypothetical protein
VQCFLAKIREVRDDGKYSVLLDGFNRIMIVELPEEKHGLISSAYLEMAYTEANIEEGLVLPETVLPGDKILLHLSYQREEVVRWNQLPATG